MKTSRILSLVAGATMALSAGAAAATQYYVQHGVWLNARSGPGTHYHVVATLNPCTPIHVIQNYNGWTKFSWNGNHYYVSTQYLQTSACTYQKKKKKHSEKDLKIV